VKSGVELDDLGGRGVQHRVATDTDRKNGHSTRVSAPIAVSVVG
jgi:hypothetical protein